MTARRSYGTGSIIEGNGIYYGKWRTGDRQIKRKIGAVRNTAPARWADEVAGRSPPARPHPHRAGSRTRRARPYAPGRRRRVLAHKQAAGVKESTIRADRAALDKWYLPMLKTRSLDRITTADVEHAMARMRKAQLSDKTVRNYVGTLRALFNSAADKRRRWTTRNPVDDVELPRAPTYAEIRYLTTDEVWMLVEAVRPVPITGTDATYEAIDKGDDRHRRHDRAAHR